MTKFEKLLYLILFIYFITNIVATFKMIKWLSRSNEPAKVEIRYLK
jgi:hypothetical protein